MSRKTISVHSVLKMVNSYLAAPDSTPDGRKAMCSVIEGVLFEAKQYAGFRYIDTDVVEGAGTKRKYYMKCS